MKYIFLLFILCGLALPQSLQARDKGDGIVVAQVYSDKQALTVGDSCLVTFVLQSAYPILKAVSNDELEDQKHATFHRLPTQRRVSRTLSPRGITYTLVWARYFVAPSTDGEIEIPKCEFKVELPNPDREGKKRTVQVKIKSNKLSIRVNPKPQPTTRDLMRRGKQLM